MNLINSFIFLILGLMTGSFLSVFVLRLRSNEGFIFGRSKCIHCKKQIKSYDLVPLISYIVLRGRCRSCEKKISRFYPFVEVLCGILFLLFYLRFYGEGVGFFLIYLTAIFLLVSVAVYDFWEMIIPNKIIYPSIIGALVLLAVNYFGNYDLFSYQTSLFNIGMGALIGSGLFFLLVFFSKEKWMGGGDVKLGLFIGLLLGFPNILVALLSAFIFGALVSIFLMLGKKKKGKDEIQFAPFLVAGSLLALFLGKYILEWYLG